MAKCVSNSLHTFSCVRYFEDKAKEFLSKQYLQQNSEDANEEDEEDFPELNKDDEEIGKLREKQQQENTEQNDFHLAERLPHRL